MLLKFIKYNVRKLLFRPRLYNRTHRIVQVWAKRRLGLLMRWKGSDRKFKFVFILAVSRMLVSPADTENLREFYIRFCVSKSIFAITFWTSSFPSCSIFASQFKRKSPEFYQKYKAAATVIYKRSPKTPPAAEVK